MKEQPTIDILMENDDKQLNLLLQLTNTYCDLQAQVSQQKRVISMQGNLINQCMERIMQLESHIGIAPHDVYRIAEQLAKRIETLEGGSVLGNFNQRLERLEANKGKMYEVSHTDFAKMVEQLVKRVDDLESYLYIHDYNYFQEEENKTGNSSFEEHEQQHYDPAETTGTHRPDCRCAWCEPQEGMIEPIREDIP